MTNTMPADLRLIPDYFPHLPEVLEDAKKWIRAGNNQPIPTRQYHTSLLRNYFGDIKIEKKQFFSKETFNTKFPHLDVKPHDPSDIRKTLIVKLTPQGGATRLFTYQERTHIYECERGLDLSSSEFQYQPEPTPNLGILIDQRRIHAGDPEYDGDEPRIIYIARFRINNPEDFERRFENQHLIAAPISKAPTFTPVSSILQKA